MRRRSKLSRRPRGAVSVAMVDGARSTGSVGPVTAAVTLTPTVDRPATVPYPLRPLIAEYTAIFDITWSPVTRRKHRDDFARFISWLEEHELPVTTESLAFLTLVEYVRDLRSRPKVTGTWVGVADARAQLAARGAQTLSANSVNAYMRPLRSLAIWLVEEGRLEANPFNRSRRRSALNPLLPSEETPTKGATLADIKALERGCAGDGPLDLRDRAIISVLVTTAARNSSVRLLRISDVDLDRKVIRFRRAKGGKTLDVALHDSTAQAIVTYLESGYPMLPGSATGDTGCIDADGYLFLSTHGTDDEPQPLTMNAVSRMLTRRYHDGGGALGSFGSHRIRHATATLLLNNGMPLDEVSRYLGHSSTLPTRRYAQHTADTLGHRAADALARSGLV